MATARPGGSKWASTFCRVCGSSRVRFLISNTNDCGEQRVSINHYRCRSCGSVFVGTSLTTAQLEAAYAALSGAFGDERELFAKWEAATTALKREITPSASILDVGAAEGGFVSHLHGAGFLDVSAHELPTPEARRALSGVAGVLTAAYHDHDWRTVPSGRFDAVTLLDLAEHVPAPMRLFEACARVLKASGVLYIHVPVVTRLDRIMHCAQRLPGGRRIGALWQNSRTSVYHLQNYTAGALERLLQRAGFDRCRIQICNELSAEARTYVRIYMTSRTRIPEALAPVIAACIGPVVRSDFWNANKAIVTAYKTPC